MKWPTLMEKVTELQRGMANSSEKMAKLQREMDNFNGKSSGVVARNGQFWWKKWHSCSVKW